MTLNDILTKIENTNRLNITVRNRTYEIYRGVSYWKLRKILRKAKGRGVVVVKKGECTKKERNRSLRMGYDIIDDNDITDIKYSLFMYEHGMNIPSRGRNTFKAVIASKFKELYRLSLEKQTE